jgi:hypothetical protein
MPTRRFIVLPETLYCQQFVAHYAEEEPGAFAAERHAEHLVGSRGQYVEGTGQGMGWCNFRKSPWFNAVAAYPIHA